MKRNLVVCVVLAKLALGLRKRKSSARKNVRMCWQWLKQTCTAKLTQKLKIQTQAKINYKEKTGTAECYWRLSVSTTAQRNQQTIANSVKPFRLGVKWVCNEPREMQHTLERIYLIIFETAVTLGYISCATDLLPHIYFSLRKVTRRKRCFVFLNLKREL